MNNTASRIWNFCENHPWLFMIVSVAAQTWFTLNNRGLWFSDEVRYANAYQNLVERGHWLVLSLNGVPYPDKPPVYFWFLRILDAITPADMPTVFFLGAALSGLFFLFASYWMARTLGFGKTISFAAILVLISNFVLVGLFHYSRMDLLFGAFIIVSHTCFFKAFSGEKQGRWPMLAFIAAGIATLIKGPLGFIFPIITTLVWLIWRGEIKKFASMKMLTGFLVMLGMLALWVLGVIIDQGPSFLLNTVIGKHVVQRATHTFHHREPLQYYFIALPLAWLPWTLLPAGLPFGRLFKLSHWKQPWANRKTDSKSAFMWIMFVSTFALLSSLSGKVFIYILPMFPPLAILSAAALTGLTQKQGTRVWTCISIFLTVLGIGLLVGADFAPVAAPVRGLGLVAIILSAAGVMLFLRRKSDMKSNLLLTALAVTIWVYPVGLLTAPSLDSAMSTKAQGQIIKEYVAEGYAPMSYKIYSGIYSYYAEHDLFETDSRKELTKKIEQAPKAILAIRKKHWDDWDNRPQGLTPIHSQPISGDVYMLVIKN